jgi:adenylate cyclase
MSQKFSYTSVARKVTAKFPVLSYVGAQVNFWIIANVLLAVLMHLNFLSIQQNFPITKTYSFTSLLISAIFLGLFYGAALGLTDHFLDRRIFRKKPLGKVIIFKTIVSLFVLVLLLAFIRFVLFAILFPSSFALSDRTWKYVFYMLVVYYFFMGIVVSFTIQVNKKFGPGVLIPLLLGKYRNPIEEERIFMFMDLRSSTRMAEKLGHIKYSSFIRDCFSDINQVLLPYNAEVYQYVGDEIVVTWRVEEGLQNFACIRFYFACQNQLLERSNYYTDQYEFTPHFKAGMHVGKVTAVEIGEVKRDIAYHGDTLNTAARIQSVCNEYNKSLLMSEELLNKIDSNKLVTESLGPINLKGKVAKVEIVSVEELL